MNTQLLLLALLEIALSVIIAIGILYAVLQIINKRMKIRYEVDDNNMAFTIFSASILFSSGYLLTGCIQPIINSLRTISMQYQGLVLVLQSTKYLFLFVAVGVVLSALVNIISIFLYNILTPGIDELENIKQGHIQSAIYMAVILILISIFVKDGYVLLLQSLMPMPGGSFD